MPLPEGPINTVSSPALRVTIDILERLHPCGPGAETLADIHGFDDWIRHRVSTIAGSTRTTREIAVIAETMHITIVMTHSAIIR